jgi:lipopolysaccharide/colanic/teichoic acid biosynthesis glycosyltransferase
MESSAWKSPRVPQSISPFNGGTNGATTTYETAEVGLQAPFRQRAHVRRNGHNEGMPWCLSKPKRVMDVLLAGSLLIIGAPVLALVAAAIVIDSPGPVFFRQWRTGYAGQRFRIFKFRTMLMNAEELKEALRPLSHHGLDSPDFKIRNDPRMTRVGRVLRRLSFDEIPNLVNVVMGDMSLVGPRPTSFDIDHYEEWHLDRLAVLPGVTGLWQISGRSEIGFDDRVKLDCQYIDHQSFWLDAKILMLTPLRVFGGRGAC